MKKLMRFDMTSMMQSLFVFAVLLGLLVTGNPSIALSLMLCLALILIKGAILLRCKDGPAGLILSFTQGALVALMGWLVILFVPLTSIEAAADYSVVLWARALALLFVVSLLAPIVAFIKSVLLRSEIPLNA